MPIELLESPFSTKSSPRLKPEQYDGRPYIIPPLWQTKTRDSDYPFLANTIRLINEKAGRTVFMIQEAEEQVDIYGQPLKDNKIKFAVWLLELHADKENGLINIPKTYSPLTWVDESGQVTCYS